MYDCLFFTHYADINLDLYLSTPTPKLQLFNMKFFVAASILAVLAAAAPVTESSAEIDARATCFCNTCGSRTDWDHGAYACVMAHYIEQCVNGQWVVSTSVENIIYEKRKLVT